MCSLRALRGRRGQRFLCARWGLGLAGTRWVRSTTPVPVHGTGLACVSCQLGRVLGLMQLPVPNFGLGWVSFLGSPIPNSHGTDPFPDRSLARRLATGMGQCPRPPRRSDPAAWARVVSRVKKRVLAAHFQALECMARARERQIPKLYINCGSSSRSSDRSEKVCVGRLRARPPLRTIPRDASFPAPRGFRSSRRRVALLPPLLEPSRLRSPGGGLGRRVGVLGHESISRPESRI